MDVIRAEEMGMCFGVRDALKVVDAIRDPSRVTIHGELVHNPVVTRRLAGAGFRQSPEGDREFPAPTPLVLITAHGVSDAERRRLEAAGKGLIDATCPLVRRVHEAARALEAEGRHVLLIGKPGHVEVRGVVEDLGRCDVIGAADQVRCYESRRLGIVCQTTMPPDVVDEACDRIRRLNPRADIRLVDTVCLPTRMRQRAMLDLLRRVDAVVVVGGRNSNNTRRLVDLCRQHRTPAHQVESASDLEPGWFAGVDTVGLTAGTSTLDESIDEVHRALERIGIMQQAGE
ncbi:4-hydroxy-3-methylbut-2-enyl diphosphate reductase [Tautonia plasticadhaerens]|uniref:4-hydroxy-3-methylbut-2-enyl diphosphate reductase n=1 Tax=Tautonia plasticadhaerens TaxID=2527974 RepID=A0A518H182_9BACT|nr:4-hydroxy-3-methylbut-2-enyl diphosphate reductase [Tautonia plasticadhaerens]QDV34604.1 4-hydroxy-3-methylbut-2-enyl diphosphate reductase [Tautonia plasticadhaerens]